MEGLVEESKEGLPKIAGRGVRKHIHGVRISPRETTEGSVHGRLDGV